MHIIRILRDYLGYSQKDLALKAGVSPADICEMENLKPFGQVDKYEKVAKYLGVPIHALVANDCRQSPYTFFENNKTVPYKKASSYANIANGRTGEDYVLKKERERVKQFCPVLSELILPYYKMSKNIGFDILSFNEEGKPIYIEVKTTCANRRNTVLLTYKEQAKAETLFKTGKTYQVHCLSNLNKENQTYTIYDYEELRMNAKMVPTEYMFVLNPTDKISGISYYRQKAGILQNELADIIGITQSKMCLYENGEKTCPITVLYRLSQILDTTIDNLLLDYTPESVS